MVDVGKNMNKTVIDINKTSWETEEKAKTKVFLLWYWIWYLIIFEKKFLYKFLKKWVPYYFGNLFSCWNVEGTSLKLYSDKLKWWTARKASENSPTTELWRYTCIYLVDILHRSSTCVSFFGLRIRDLPRFLNW